MKMLFQPDPTRRVPVLPEKRFLIRFRRCLAVRVVAPALCALAVCGTAAAADFFVNRNVGSDDFNGLSATAGEAGQGPFRTILRAVKTAGAGDTVHLAPSEQPYPESVLFNTHPTWYHPGGEPGRPLTIDGHGATVTGADPCPTNGWTLWRDRTYRRDDFPATGGMMVNGKRVPALSPPAALAAGDWIYFRDFKHLYWRPASTPIGEVRMLHTNAEPVTVEPKRWGPAAPPGVVRLVGVSEPAAMEIAGVRVGAVTLKERLKPGQWANEGGVLYYHLPEGKTFADLDIQCVVRGCGVQIGGSTSHLVVQNLHATRFSNDGFNIHGGGSNIVFRNITATYCFDEGYSAHDNIRSEIDGGTFLFNASGHTDVNRAHTKARNLLIAFNDGIGFLGLGDTFMEVENVILINNGHQLGGSRITACNILAITTAGNTGILTFGGEATVERLTAMGWHGLRLEATTTLSLRDVVFAGKSDWHIRADDPEKRLAKAERLILSPDLTISYGSRYPWKAMPLATWLDQQHPGQASPADIPAVEQIVQSGGAGLPAGTGCSPDLIEKAVAFLRLHADQSSNALSKPIAP